MTSLMQQIEELDVEEWASLTKQCGVSGGRSQHPTWCGHST